MGWDCKKHKLNKTMNLYDYTKEKPDYEVEQERWEKEGYDVWVKLHTKVLIKAKQSTQERMALWIER